MSTQLMKLLIMMGAPCISIADQAYTNTACYMRLRHRSKWIATVDIDEFIDVQPHTLPAEGRSPFSKQCPNS